jgi:hypothetical protein
VTANRASLARYENCPEGLAFHRADPFWRSRAATIQDILELWRRKCNKREIAEEIAPWLICPASPARAFLTHAHLALP